MRFNDSPEQELRLWCLHCHSVVLKKGGIERALPTQVEKSIDKLQKTVKALGAPSNSLHLLLRVLLIRSGWAMGTTHH